MLRIICNSDMREEIANSLVDYVVNRMEQYDIESLAGGCADDDLNKKVHSLVCLQEDGFVFDPDDLLGKETYGNVFEFSNDILDEISDLKEEFPSIGIDGYLWFIFTDAYECSRRVRFFAEPSDEDVQRISQLQCVCCQKWVDAKSAFKLIPDDGEFYPESDEGPLLPNGFQLDGVDDDDAEAAWCICSEECAVKIGGE